MPAIRRKRHAPIWPGIVLGAVIAGAAMHYAPAGWYQITIETQANESIPEALLHSAMSDGNPGWVVKGIVIGLFESAFGMLCYVIGKGGR